MAKKNSSQTEAPTEKINKYKDLEDELNKDPIPFYFHESDVINMEINNNKIRIKICLYNFFAPLDFIDDNHRAILEVVYEDVKIKNLYMYDGFDFRIAEILCFEEESNGDLSLHIGHEPFGLYYSIRFSYKKFRWSMCDIITEDEFRNLDLSAVKVADAICDLTEKHSPKWAKFED